MVGVAQLVEHPVVVRDVAGSSPVAHPIKKVITLSRADIRLAFMLPKIILYYGFAPVADPEALRL